MPITIIHHHYAGVKLTIGANISSIDLQNSPLGPTSYKLICKTHHWVRISSCAPRPGWGSTPSPRRPGSMPCIPPRSVQVTMWELKILRYWTENQCDGKYWWKTHDWCSSCSSLEAIRFIFNTVGDPYLLVAVLHGEKRPSPLWLGR